MTPSRFAATETRFASDLLPSALPRLFRGGWVATGGDNKVKRPLHGLRKRKGGFQFVDITLDFHYLFLFVGGMVTRYFLLLET